MSCFPRMDNPLLTIYQHFKATQHFKCKEKVSTIASVGFKTLKEHARKWTAVKNFFQNLHLILDKCNTITAKSLENKTVNFTAAAIS